VGLGKGGKEEKATRMRKLFNRPQAESEELLELRAIVAAVHLSQAVIEFDLDGVVLDANANFLAVLGYELSEIKGRHHRMFVDPAEAGSPAYAEFWKRLNAGEFVADKFVRYGKNGKRAVIEAAMARAKAKQARRHKPSGKPPVQRVRERQGHKGARCRQRQG
jgi:methyl-accepting chemotaxis protein